MCSQIDPGVATPPSGLQGLLSAHSAVLLSANVTISCTELVSKAATVGRSAPSGTDQGPERSLPSSVGVNSQKVGVMYPGQMEHPIILVWLSKTKA